MDYINNLFSLNGKVAIVVGGSGVLGGEMAKTLAKAGAKTAVFYSGNREGAEEQAAEIEKEGGEAMICQANVREQDSLQQAIDKVEENWGGIDILVNAPGVNSTTPVMEITEEEWNKILDINLKGAFLASRMVAEKMKAQGKGGSIINISSASSEIPLSKVFTYSISKAGMNNMTRFLAREWAPDNIRVNALMPGFFPAEQNRKILTEERRKSIFGHTPMNRYGEPEELSGAILWLASEKAASFVTGAVIPVDGGFTAQTI
ncbi:SDR family oxidoreductase [Gracilimonas mengyeensis]|uniref:NAD(P)-dependent dehydrogenase, short-chain alcohol dehydrogenase family n=1 Tax=Gracilimonas mengyeensis TaxID=1302730 RepID=A0A521FD89_9BACT|nr:SDR family oxidoreductase [Gracilimonas mengyeensis]SMO94167.1 NAD(P)-dependent dehydrogenase, short-chain alcohol dehydrogenase family [Gracilimonas mengyeensis]